MEGQDKREVNMLSTFPDDTCIEKRRRTRLASDGTEVIRKPRIVEECNQHMGGVDKSDQLVLYYGYAHRSIKWWKRVFFHILDLALVNAHIVHNITVEKQLTQLDFRMSVATGLLEGYQQQVHTHYVAPRVELPLRLTERPFPDPVPSDTPYGGRPQCEVCRARKKKKAQTQY